MFNKIKTLGLAAVVTVAMPVSAFAAMISGQIDITGNVHLPTSNFNSSGNADLEPTGVVTIATGDFSGISFGTLADVFDIDFTSPDKIWSVGGFTFTALSFSDFQDTTTKAFKAIGTISGNSFDDSLGTLTFTSQTNDPAVKVSFSSTTTVPVPAAGVLLVGGLGALAVARRRKDKKAA